MSQVPQELTGGWLIEEDAALNAPAWSDCPSDNDNKLHIVPHNDLFPHVLSYASCWCHPTIDEEDPHLVVHNSADGRELYETGARRMN
jgi:hypothetical protein